MKINFKTNKKNIYLMKKYLTLINNFCLNDKQIQIYLINV